EPEHAEEQGNTQVDLNNEADPERQHREEIDESACAEHVFESRPAASGAIGRVLGRSPNTKAILERKNNQRDELERAEPAAESGENFRLGLENDREQIERDQDDEGPV